MIMSIIIKKHSKTNKAFGKSPEKRSVEELLSAGVINLNKPKGPTSHDVVERVKRILRIKKAGHGGTLDPAVTGVLPIALGKATKALIAILLSGKEYVCLARFHKEIERDELEKAIKGFVGKIEQLPPIRSAVKRVKRLKQIYRFEILEQQGRYFLFKIDCQAGVYIRKLIHDLGLALNIGAHMVQLVRTRAGPFKLDQSVRLNELVKAESEKMLKEIILPIEKIAENLKKVWIEDKAVDKIAHGGAVDVNDIVKLDDSIAINDTVALFTLKNELIAFGIAKISSAEIMEKNEGLAIKTWKVFLEPEIYPHMKRYKAPVAQPG